MAAAGIGAVHHMGYEHSYGSDNELSAHLELQYSQFFNAKKNVSLDLKARALLYQTNFDLEYGQADHAAQHVDANLGLNVGLTFYLGKKGANGWRRGGSTVHEREYKETQKVIMKVKEDERPRAVKSGTLTFSPANKKSQTQVWQIKKSDRPGYFMFYSPSADVALDNGNHSNDQDLDQELHIS